jgi:hypothetical protein
MSSHSDMSFSASFAHSISPHIQWSEDELLEHASPGKSLVKDLVGEVVSAITNTTLSQMANAIRPGEGHEVPPSAFNITHVLGKAANNHQGGPGCPQHSLGGVLRPHYQSMEQHQHHYHHQRSPHDQRPAGTGPFAGGLQSGGICDDFYLINLLSFNSDYFLF